MSITNELKIVCARLKETGKTWPEVETEVTRLGFRRPNGKPFHNAELASATVNSIYGEHLRQRTYKSTPALAPKSNKGRKTGSKNLSTKIKELRKLGLSDATFAKVVDELVGK